MMTMFVRRLALAGAFMLLGACAGASTKPVLWTGFADHPKGYLKAETAFSAAAFLPAWPVEGSPRDLADRATFRATRGLEASERWRLAAADAEVETPRAPLKAFACALGADIDPVQAPALTRLLGAALPDVELVQKAVKTQMFRPRPFVTDPRPICIAPEPWLAKSGSYPSGHAAIGWAWGLTLSRLAPDRQGAITRRAMAYGDSRIICGVHYVSDVDAGRAVGAALTARWQSLPAYEADIRRARHELARLRKTAPAPSGCDVQARALASPVG